MGAGDQDTVLLLHFDGPNGSTSISDFSRFNHAVTAVGSVQLTTSQSKFGPSSLRCGTGSYASIPDNDTAFDFGGSDFTMECFVRFNTVTEVAFMAQLDDNMNTSTWQLIRANTGQLVFTLRYGSGSQSEFASDSAWSATTGVWYHLAAVRNGNNVCVFIDGVQVNTTTSFSGTLNNTSLPLLIGRRGNSTSLDFDGWIDELRITKGKALYTSNFMPPSTPSNVAGPMSRDCFFIETSSNGTPADVPLVTATAISGCDSGSSGVGKCC